MFPAEPAWDNHLSGFLTATGIFSPSLKITRKLDPAGETFVVNSIGNLNPDEVISALLATAKAVKPKLPQVDLYFLEEADGQSGGQAGDTQSGDTIPNEKRGETMQPHSLQ
jgi:hypothetical protein